MALTSSGRLSKRSWTLAVEMEAWLNERAERAETSASAILRQVIRAAMEAEDKQGRAA